MKLSAFVAAAAVIGSSFLIPVPAEARNGWIRVGENIDNETLYMKVDRRNGAFRNVSLNFGGGIYQREINCNSWYRRYPGESWEPIMPQSIFETAAIKACR